MRAEEPEAVGGVQVEGEGLGGVGSRGEDVIEVAVTELVEVDPGPGRVDAREAEVGWHRWRCHGCCCSC